MRRGSREIAVPLGNCARFLGIFTSEATLSGRARSASKFRHESEKSGVVADSDHSRNRANGWKGVDLRRLIVVKREAGIGATRSPDACRRRTGFHPMRQFKPVF